MNRLSLPLWTEKHAAPPLPMTCAEMEARGWDAVDVVFVSGDAYVDHPSFAMAILGRVLEAAGFRVAILSQPDWHSCEPWRQFGRPRLFFGISAGNMDSLINHYTANKKVRNDDAYSPGGRIGLPPGPGHVALLPPGAGGLSRRAGDCRRRRGIIATPGPLRLLERHRPPFDPARLQGRLARVWHGGEEHRRDCPAIGDRGNCARPARFARRGVCAGARESEELFSGGSQIRPSPDRRICDPPLNDYVPLPSYEEVKSDKLAFVEATRLIHINTNPYNAKALVQFHERQAVVATPPAFPLSQAEMDAIYDLPYTRRPHPSYTEPIPAHEMIKDSVTLMRGCFGGCTFCSITAHQGRIIQSRSQESVLKEVRKMADDPEFHGVISDVGGPTANMYQMRCSRPEVEAKCKRLSCVHPTICKLLGTDHGPLIELMKRARTEPGIRKVLVASGIRMDLAQLSPEYMKELAAHHVGGHLKVAPEHTDSHVLGLMKKPDNVNFEGFAQEFQKASAAAGKPKQFIVPYYIASHPGSDLHAMIELAVFLKRNGYRPDQVQDFIPAPFDVATCMYYTGIDPFSKQEVYVARHLRDRKLQRALLQFFKPENYFEVRKALEEAGRTDLIGGGCDALIPAQPPKEALRARQQNADREMRGEYVHTVPNAKGKKGYRPGRRTARRQDRR